MSELTHAIDYGHFPNNADSTRQSSITPFFMCIKFDVPTSYFTVTDIDALGPNAYSCIYIMNPEVTDLTQF